MKKHNLNLSLQGPGTRVELDGEVIFPTSVTVVATVDQFPIATIDFPLIGAGEVGGEVVVKIPAETQDALLMLGWTPPEECPITKEP